MDFKLPESLAARYRPEQELGRGGFGHVLRVRDLQLDRPVALKLLELDVGDPEVRARFEREARVTASLRHPGVVEVYDHGVTSEGQPFIAYAYVAGRSLGEARPDLETLRRWAGEIAEALQAVHEAELVHRDVKPANILVTRDERTVLCDLGIVRSRSGREGTVVTAEGMILGTPPYMAPELWSGDPASPASDQWAWAATMVELWRGRGVYAGSEPGEIAREVVGWTPDLTDVRREEPRLADVFLRALAPDPGDRFPSMAAASRALGATPPTARDVRAHARPTSRRRWAAPLLGALAVVGVLAGFWGGAGSPQAPLPGPGGAGTGLATPATQDLPVEERPAVRALAEACRELQEVVGRDPEDPGAWHLVGLQRDFGGWWELLEDPRLVARVRAVLEALHLALGEIEGDRDGGEWLVQRAWGLRGLFQELDRSTDLARGGSRLGQFLVLHPGKRRSRQEASDRWRDLRLHVGDFLANQERSIEGGASGPYLSPRLAVALRVAQAAGSDDLSRWSERVIRAGLAGQAPLVGDGEVLHVVARILRGENIRGSIGCAERTRQVVRFHRWLMVARSLVSESEHPLLWGRGLEVELRLDVLCGDRPSDPGKEARLLDLVRWGEHERAAVGAGYRDWVVKDLEEAQAALRDAPLDHVEDPESLRVRLLGAVERLLWRARGQVVTPEQLQADWDEVRRCGARLADIVAPSTRGNPWARLHVLGEAKRVWELVALPEFRVGMLELVRAEDRRIERVVHAGAVDRDKLARRMLQVAQMLGNVRVAARPVAPNLDFLADVAASGRSARDVVALSSWMEGFQAELEAGMRERARWLDGDHGPFERYWGLVLSLHIADPTRPRWIAATIERGVGSPGQLVDEGRELALISFALREYDIHGRLACEDRQRLFPGYERWLVEARGRHPPGELIAPTLEAARVLHAISDVCEGRALGEERAASLERLGALLERDWRAWRGPLPADLAERAGRFRERLERWEQLEEEAPAARARLLSCLGEMSASGPTP